MPPKLTYPNDRDQTRDQNDRVLICDKTRKLLVKINNVFDCYANHMTRNERNLYQEAIDAFSVLLRDNQP